MLRYLLSASSTWEACQARISQLARQPTDNNRQQLLPPSCCCLIRCLPTKQPVGTFQYVLDWNSDVAIERAPDATLSELPWIHPGSFEITWREEEESKDYYKA